GICIGMLMGCKPDETRKAIHEFKAVEHRLEYVASIRGVDYYNDSKATNVDATIKALESFPANIHVILGGKDKGSDYTVLNELLRNRVKRVYTIGAAADKIESHIQGAAEIIHAETLDAAVKRASALASPGDVVLLAVTLLLVFGGLVMVFSASAVMAKERYGSPYTFLIKQAAWAAAGTLFMLLGMRIDYRRLKHPATVFSLLGGTMLMLISVFF